jgi:predicted nucleic acid-binding protein
MRTTTAVFDESRVSRLLADFIIGSHALVHADRFMTLDPKRYAREFPELKLT